MSEPYLPPPEAALRRQPTAPLDPHVAPTARDITPEPGLPGEHRGGFSRLPTAPIDVTIESAPAEPAGGFDPDRPAEWALTVPPSPRRWLAPWALGSSIVGLLVSLVVGWGFPIGIMGIVSAILALRRPRESRGVAIWALVLGILSIVYSIGWLIYAASRASLFG